MKLQGKKKLRKNPAFIVNSSGKLTYMNEKAFDTFPSIKVGDDISNIVDIDYIKKLSMYTNKMDVIKTKVNTYGRAAVRVTGGGIYKAVHIYLENSNDSEEDFADDKKMFFAFNDAIKRTDRTEINVLEFLYSIVENINCRKGYSYKKFAISANADDVVFAERPRLEALIISSVFILNEVNYIDVISMSAKKIGTTLEFSLSVKSDAFGKDSIADAEEIMISEFPETMSRIELVNAICDESKVDYSVSYSGTEMIMTFKIKENRKLSYKLYTSPEDMYMSNEDRISGYIDAFGIERRKNKEH